MQAKPNFTDAFYVSVIQTVSPSALLLQTTETLTTTVTTNSYCYTTEKKLLLIGGTKACSRKRAIDVSSIKGLSE
jgi:hypothetical protein